MIKVEVPSAKPHHLSNATKPCGSARRMDGHGTNEMRYGDFVCMCVGLITCRWDASYIIWPVSLLCGPLRCRTLCCTQAGANGVECDLSQDANLWDEGTNGKG